MQFVNSSDLRSVGYDRENHTLRIMFHSGGVYDYPNVPESIYIGLMSASSKGTYFHRHIKPHYMAIKMR